MRCQLCSAAEPASRTSICYKACALTMGMPWSPFMTYALCGVASICLGVQVREACSLLDLDVLFYPCPKDGPNWRPKVGTHCSHRIQRLPV